MLPEQAMFEAHALAAEADLMIAIGSSLEVYPVASLPRVAQRRGGRAGAGDAGPDSVRPDAEVKLTGDVVEELEAVLAAL